MNRTRDLEAINLSFSAHQSHFDATSYSMASTQGKPNPLRPYHDFSPRVSPVSNASSANTTQSGGAPSFLASSDREVVIDIDYSDYLSDGSISVLGLLKSLLDQGLWKYTSILLAQPFEVAKITLQLQDAAHITDGEVKPERSRRKKSREEYYYSDDDDEDEVHSLFTSSARSQDAKSWHAHQRRRYSSSRSRSRSQSPAQTSSQQEPRSKALKSTSSLTAVLSSLWTTEGAWGVWKGSNSTFWHSVLLSTITSFLRSFFCAVFALPDPTIAITALPSSSTLVPLDILSSPSPITSLMLSVCASGLAGLILSPLDVARIKLIATPSTQPPRSILSTLSSLGSWSIPTSIAHITLLHSTLPTLITTSTPLFLRSQLGLDATSTPSSYAALTFLSQAIELGIRLPVETILHRGQLHSAQEMLQRQQPSAITSQARSHESRASPFQTTIPVGAYKGLWGTWYHIVYEEGSRPGIVATVASAASSARPGIKTARRKGQGLEGLYRGWRVGAWALLGKWTAHTFGGSSATVSVGSGAGSAGSSVGGF